MMNTVDLTCNEVNVKISTTYGMSLIAFCVGGVNVLDVSRETNFLQARKGLGPIIGPHFNQSPIIPIVEESRFEHISNLKALGIKDIFQHGVGRYIPWDFEQKQNTVIGFISGETEVAGYKLKFINGFDFKMSVKYSLDESGLHIDMEASGEKPIQVGTHFYYDLVSRDTAYALLDVAGGRKTINFKDKKLDDVFIPEASIDDKAYYQLITDTYELDTVVQVKGSKKNTYDTLIVHSPENARFLCVEPISQFDRTKNDKCEFHSSILLVPRKK